MITLTTVEINTFKNKLLHSFRVDIEPGEDHLSDNIVSSYYKRMPDEVVDCLQDMVIESDKHTSNIIRCIGRLKDVCDGLRLIATLGLQNDCIEIRDSAVSALESWGDKMSIYILSKHKETEPWLKDYIEKVLWDNIVEDEDDNMELLL